MNETTNLLQVLDIGLLGILIWMARRFIKTQDSHGQRIDTNEKDIIRIKSECHHQHGANL